MDEKEREKLIIDNLPVVGYQVSDLLRRVPSHVQREDLAAAGSLALVQASQSFDPSRGVPFSSYAAIRVKGAMMDELRSMDWASRGARKRAKELDEMTATLTAASGRAPTREELASALGVDASQVEAAQQDSARRVLSLDGAPNTGGGEETRSIDLADSELTPEERLIEDERRLYVHAAVAALPERLRYVVEETFFHDRQVSDLAEELGVTQSRVSQLRTEALALMREGINAHLEESSAEPEAQGAAARRRNNYYEEVGKQAQRLAGRDASEAAAGGGPKNVKKSAKNPVATRRVGGVKLPAGAQAGKKATTFIPGLGLRATSVNVASTSTNTKKNGSDGKTSPKPEAEP